MTSADTTSSAEVFTIDDDLVIHATSTRHKSRRKSKPPLKNRRVYSRQSSSGYSSGGQSSSEVSSNELSYHDLSIDFENDQTTGQYGPGTGLAEQQTSLMPDAGGFFILSTKSISDYDDDAEPEVKSDPGFSIYDNWHLPESISDEDDGSKDNRNTMQSSKIKILTMTYDDSQPTSQSPTGRVKSSGKKKQNWALAESRDSYFCPELGCERYFSEEPKLVRHLKIVHTPKLHPCTKCDKSFRQLGHLQVHLRTVHTKDTPFECKVCHRKFNVSSNRNRHQRLHFDKKSYHYLKNSPKLEPKFDELMKMIPLEPDDS